MWEDFLYSIGLVPLKRHVEVWDRLVNEKMDLRKRITKLRKFIHDYQLISANQENDCQKILKETADR